MMIINILFDQYRKSKIITIISIFDHILNINCLKIIIKAVIISRGITITKK